MWNLTRARTKALPASRLGTNPRKERGLTSVPVKTHTSNCEFAGMKPLDHCPLCGASRICHFEGAATRTGNSLVGLDTGKRVEYSVDGCPAHALPLFLGGGVSEGVQPLRHVRPHASRMCLAEVEVTAEDSLEPSSTDIRLGTQPTHQTYDWMTKRA